MGHVIVPVEKGVIRNAQGERINAQGETLLEALTRLNREKQGGLELANPEQAIRLTDIQAVAQAPRASRTPVIVAALVFAGVIATVLFVRLQ